MVGMVNTCRDMVDYKRMSIYKKSPAQQKYLKRMYAARAKDDDKCCDCAGCDKCTGFVAGCKCDILSGEELRKYRR